MPGRVASYLNLQNCHKKQQTRNEAVTLLLLPECGQESDTFLNGIIWHDGLTAEG